MTKSKPMETRRKSDFRLRLPFSWLTLILIGSAAALHVPDTSSLKKQYRVLERVAGKPSLLHRVERGDTLFLELSWRGNRIEGLTYRQKVPFEDGPFHAITSEHSQGATWHELPDESAIPLRDRFPGLEQHWFLQGFEQTGWLGSGLDGHTFYLTFLQTPPDEPELVTDELRLQPGLLAYLDTSSLWLRGGCGGKDTTCFLPLREKRWKLYVEGRPLQRLRLEHESGESLQDIRETFFAISPEQHAEYAADLSGILFMEAQVFLMRVAQSFPRLLTWPSWQMQSLNKGHVPVPRFRELLANPPSAPFPLPALALDLPDGHLEVSLDFAGRFFLSVTAIPGRKTR